MNVWKWQQNNRIVSTYLQLAACRIPSDPRKIQVRKKIDWKSIIRKMFLSIGRYIFYNKYEYLINKKRSKQKYNDELKTIHKDRT